MANENYLNTKPAQATPATKGERITPQNAKGLKNMRRYPNGEKNDGKRIHCENCDCDRYVKCTCQKKA